jgi:hypothetical protein
MVELNKLTYPPEARRRWETPELKRVGKVGEVLQGGGGKATISAADMGDSNKPTGQA